MRADLSTMSDHLMQIAAHVSAIDGKLQTALVPVSPGLSTSGGGWTMPIAAKQLTELTQTVKSLEGQVTLLDFNPDTFKDLQLQVSRMEEKLEAPSKRPFFSKAITQRLDDIQSHLVAKVDQLNARVLSLESKVEAVIVSEHIPAVRQFS